MLRGRRRPHCGRLMRGRCRAGRWLFYHGGAGGQEACEDRNNWCENDKFFHSLMDWFQGQIEGQGASGRIRHGSFSDAETYSSPSLARHD